MSVPVSAWSALAAAVSAGVGVLAYVRSEQVSRQRQDDVARSIDAEAYKRAKDIYDSAIDQLQEQNKSQALQIARMSARIGQLETAMRAAGIPVPEEA